jgi:cadmium resistance transport/sequestration family protein
MVTNIDDLLLLSFYFAHPDFKTRHIVLGQYAGVYALVAISLIGFILGNFVGQEWLGLLGLIPIALGIKLLMGNAKDDDSAADSTIRSKNQWLSVALITIANGGDNIGVYTPLFATLSASLLMLYVLVFAIMILVLCGLAYYLVKHPRIKSAFAKYGHIVLPIFLILLGGWILLEAGTYRLISTL